MYNRLNLQAISHLAFLMWNQELAFVLSVQGSLETNLNDEVPYNFTLGHELTMLG